LENAELVIVGPQIEVHPFLGDLLVVGALEQHPNLDLRHTAVALWIAAGADPKEVAARAEHSSVSFTLDRYGHLFPEADTALRDRPDVLYGAARPTPEGTVVRLRGQAGRGPQCGPRRPGNDKSTARSKPTTL
jgi:hypothetical protein